MKNKKVMSGWMLSLLILLVIAFPLALYFVLINVDDNTVVKEEKKEEIKTIKKEDSKDFIYPTTYEVEEKEINLTGYSVNPLLKELGVPDSSTEVSFEGIRVPYINIDSTDANIVNMNMKTLYINLNQKFISLKNKGTVIYGYKTYETANTISVLVGYSYTAGMPYYYSYNFDKKTGKLINFMDAIKMYDLNYKFTLTKLKTNIKETITTTYGADSYNKFCNGTSTSTINNNNLDISIAEEKILFITDKVLKVIPEVYNCDTRLLHQATLYEIKSE